MKVFLCIVLTLFIFITARVAKSEIVFEEREGVLYVSNVYPVEMQGKPTLIHDKLAPWQSEEIHATKDSTSGKTKYDEYMATIDRQVNTSSEYDPYAVAMSCWSAGETDLFFKYKEEEDLGDLDRIAKFELSGEYWMALHTIKGMYQRDWDEFRRIMVLQKEKMQNTPAD